MDRIFLVEDDASLAGLIAKGLTGWGYEVTAAKDFTNVLMEFSASNARLVLLDVSLPAFNGFYWCGEIRKVSKVPILFLSSRTEDMDVVMGMNLGGDDYVFKPFSMDVLVAKIQSLLRRAYDYGEGESLTLRGARFSPAALTVTSPLGSVLLTRNEARILELLLLHKNTVVTRETLMLRLWDSDAFIDDNTLSVNVARLRKALEPLGLSDAILTHKNLGYAIHE